MTKLTDEERADQISTITNGFGQTLLTLTNGDWDMALSVSLSLFASCLAQAAIEHCDDPEKVFEECGVPARNAVLAFYREFKRAEDGAADAAPEGSTTDG